MSGFLLWLGQAWLVFIFLAGWVIVAGAFLPHGGPRGDTDLPLRRTGKNETLRRRVESA
jgi:hypothetical protein